MSNLHGKSALITGASAGIGAALAAALATAGVNLTLCARRAEPLEALAAALPGPCLAVAADVTQPDHRQRLIDTHLARWQGLDILVNNAGLGSYGDFLATDEDTWRELFEINLFAPVLLTRLALPALQASGAGLVLNVASIAGLVAHTERVAPYVASKHALVGFSRALARDLAGSGVRVKAACPHLTDTNFFAASAGAAELAPVAARARRHMDSAADVAAGILAGLDRDGLIIFPTAKPAETFARLREL